MNEKIIAGLKQLDVKVDSSWTQDGLVNLNAFKFVIGGESVTREQLEEAAPGFNRETAPTYFNTVDPSADPVIENFNVDTEQKTSSMSIEVNVSLSEALKTLAGVGHIKLEDISKLSHDELSGIMKDVPTRRNDLINLREEFNALMEKEFNLLIQIEDAYNKSRPKENHADLVKRIHMANVNEHTNVNQGRQRVAPVIPPLKK